MDTVMLTVDERTALLAAYLVNYGFVRELVRRDYTIVRCPWRLAGTSPCAASRSPGVVG